MFKKPGLPIAVNDATKKELKAENSREEAPCHELFDATKKELKGEKKP